MARQRRTRNGSKWHKPEEIVQKLRQVDVLVGQGMRRVDAIGEVRISAPVVQLCLFFFRHRADDPDKPGVHVDLHMVRVRDRLGQAGNAQPKRAAPTIAIQRSNPVASYR